LHLLRLDDRKLAARVGAGDEAAFATLYQRHNAALLSFCRHMVGNREDGEDALQQTFLRAHRALVAGQVPDSVRSWLFAIARNRCLTLIAARRTAAVPVEDVEISYDGLSEQVRSRADLRELVADLTRLPDDQRAALVMSELGDLSHVEIADAIGCQPGKVKALVFQARTSLIADRDARDTPCDDIRAELAVAAGGTLRRGPLKRHLRQCDPCRAFQIAVGHQRTGLATILPVTPSAGLQAAVLGGAALSGGASAGGVLGGAAAGGASVAVPAGIAGLGVAAAGGVAIKGVVAKAAITAAVAAGGAVGLHASAPHDAGPPLRTVGAAVTATPAAGRPGGVAGAGAEREVAFAPPEALLPPPEATPATASGATPEATATPARRHRRLRRLRHRRALLETRGGFQTHVRPRHQVVSGEGETPLVPTGTPTPPRRPRVRRPPAAPTPAPTGTATPTPTPRPRRPRPRAVPPAASPTATPAPSPTPPPRPRPRPRPRKPPPPPPAPTPAPTATPESTPEPTATPTP
jgi:RNA polymerase sigma factor (sigma-70 family)